MIETPSIPDSKRLDGIHVLRFLAAMGVVLFHIGSSLEISYGAKSNFFFWGASGVDVFFIISGFIIAYSAKPEKGVKDFVIRRIARIVPLYWFLTFGLAAVALILPNLLNSTSFEIRHFLKSLFFIPHEAPNGVVKPLLFLGWTLNYEMFFYAVFAISLLFKNKAAMICSMVMIMLVISGLIFPNSSSVLYNFYTNPLILEFLYGIGLFYIYKVKPYIFKNFRYAFLILFILSVIINLIVPDLPRFIGQGVPAFFLVAFGLSFKTFTSKPLCMMVFGGELSYSLYLSHPYIIQVVIKILAPRVNMPVMVIGCVLAVIACIIASYILYKIVERPGQTLVRNILSTKKEAPV